MILKTIKTKDYELIDSGNGEKLERFGEFVFRRPDRSFVGEKKLEKKTGIMLSLNLKEIKNKMDNKDKMPKIGL